MRHTRHDRIDHLARNALRLERAHHLSAPENVSKFHHAPCDLRRPSEDSGRHDPSWTLVPSCSLMVPPARQFPATRQPVTKASTIRLRSIEAAWARSDSPCRGLDRRICPSSSPSGSRPRRSPRPATPPTPTTDPSQPGSAVRWTANSNTAPRPPEHATASDTTSVRYRAIRSLVTPAVRRERGRSELRLSCARTRLRAALKVRSTRIYFARSYVY